MCIKINKYGYPYRKPLYLYRRTVAKSLFIKNVFHCLLRQRHYYVFLCFYQSRFPWAANICKNINAF